jgi:hypothetical protein
VRSVKMDSCLISILIESVSTNLMFNFEVYRIRRRGDVLILKTEVFEFGLSSPTRRSESGA